MGEAGPLCQHGPSLAQCKQHAEIRSVCVGAQVCAVSMCVCVCVCTVSVCVCEYTGVYVCRNGIRRNVSRRWKWNRNC